MRRFKAWLFVWLMGEHFAEMERDVDALRESHEAIGRDLNKRIAGLNERLDHLSSQPKAKPAPRATHSFAEFQRLTATDDQEVQ